MLLGTVSIGTVLGLPLCTHRAVLDTGDMAVRALRVCADGVSIVSNVRMSVAEQCEDVCR